MSRQKKNKYGEILYPCRVSELDTNTRMTVWWTSAQLEFADTLVRTGGLCLVCGYGYFYKLEELSNAIKKAYKDNGNYWRERLSRSY